MTESEALREALSLLSDMVRLVEEAERLKRKLGAAAAGRALRSAADLVDPQTPKTKGGDA